VSITGNSLVSGIQDVNLCASADTVNAVTITETTKLTYAARNVEGAIDTIALHGEGDGPASLDELIFDGMRIGELTRYATHAFGPQFADHKSYRGSWPGGRPSSLTTGNQPRPATDVLNWGCPGAMDERSHCTTHGGDTTHYPIVVIDAGGGTIILNGDHGQGWLIVVNGHLDIQGNFTYRGVIAVEGLLDIRGTGSGDAKIEGAVLATGKVSLARGTESSDVAGSAVIRYNRCAIASAENALNQQLLNQANIVFSRRPYGWFESNR
jgi:hypothetical protein